MTNQKTIGTKVSRYAEQLLSRICAKQGIKIYEMLQMMCDCIIRYMSDKTNITPEMERAMQVFEHMDGWHNAFNLAQPKQSIEVQSAIYFIGDNKKRGERAVMIERPYFGTWSQEQNIQHIFEAMLCKTFPERYRKLRQLAKDLDCKSQLEVIDLLIDRAIEGTDTDTIREMFEDCNRSDYGRKPSEHVYRRKMHKDIESMKIQFSPDDVPDLPETRDEEFRPFGGEW